MLVRTMVDRTCESVSGVVRCIPIVQLGMDVVGAARHAADASVAAVGRAPRRAGGDILLRCKKSVQVHLIVERSRTVKKLATLHQRTVASPAIPTSNVYTHTYNRCMEL